MEKPNLKKKWRNNPNTAQQLLAGVGCGFLSFFFFILFFFLTTATDGVDGGLVGGWGAVEG